MTEHRTKIDYAHCIRWLVDQVYPQADYVRIVQDNLNTHTAAALYEAFPAPEARRILQRVEFHYTPKHGSWLNMAEIEISIFARGCLSRRVESMPVLRQRIAALEAEPFDALLLDVQLPGADGFEVAARIRARERHTGRHLPIIALTANAMAEQIEACRTAGMNDHLAKPIDRDLMLATIERWGSARPCGGDGNFPAASQGLLSHSAA